MPAKLGCCRTAPLQLHLEHRADRRRRSLDASGQYLMMKGTKGTGFRCMLCSHTTQLQGAPRRTCSCVGGGVSVLMRANMALSASAERPRWIVLMSAETVEGPSVKTFRVLSAPTTLSYQGSGRLNRAPNIRLADRRARFGAVLALRRDICIRGHPIRVAASRATRRSPRRQNQSQD